MRKQANNTFTKGLFKDFHPLTVGNDVMTDALNATIVTMNGNEGILQNDMGNGRVESAFLPAGYVPVGMKEYGGIIYVASYNPVTNKGQIGSFPSPERNIDQSEEGGPENPLQLLDQAYIRLYKYSKFNGNTPLQCQKGIAGLVNKTDIFGKDRYMRAGDKFGFYFHDYNEQNQLYNDGRNKRPILSNYYQYDYKNDKPYSGDQQDNEIKNNPSGIQNRLALWDEKNQVYRNNIITLSTQILDVNNNLRDITEQLKRFNEDNEKIDTKDIRSKIDIFNSGYFINESENKDWDPVNVERNKKALNTYNNKLYGKMFLVGKANTLEYIENGTTYTSHSSENGKYIEIVFNVNYFYNCPEDYLYEPILYYFVEPVGEKHVYIDENCQTKHENIGSSDPTVDENPSVTIYGPKDGQDNQEYFKYNLINEVRTVDYGKTGYSDAKVIETYDPITNLYKRTYQIRCETTFTEGYLHYVIVPRMKNIPGYEGNETNFGNKSIGTGPSKITIEQLTHLAIEGTIDFSKIGTGFNNMLYWNYRYLETIDGAPYMQLRWGLDDYLLTSDEISDLKMEFFSLNEFGDLNGIEGTFNPSINSDQDHLLKVWQNVIADPIDSPNRGPRAQTTIDPKPQYTINISDKYSYTGPFMEYLYLNETELKKRHIYIVRLSRIKNGQYEFLAYRILITTSIYNDLFSGKEAEDDYCADSALPKIKQRNEIKFDLSIIESNQSKLQLEKQLNEVYKKGVDGKWQIDNNEIFKEFILKYDPFTNTDLNPTINPEEKLLVEYYKSVMNSTIEIKIHIPEKYPFSIDENEFGYDQIKLNKVIENEYDKYPENTKLPVFDIDDPPVKKSEYKIDGNVYDPDGVTITHHNFTLEAIDYFPSVMTYKYSDRITKITPKYIYRNLIEYIMQQINNTGYFPIVGVDDMEGPRQYCWVDLGYFQLDANSKVNLVQVYAPGEKQQNADMELFNQVCDNKAYKKYRLFDSTNVNKFLNSRPNDSNFKQVFLFASPLIFQMNKGAMDNIGLHYKSNEDDLNDNLYNKFEHVQLNISKQLAGDDQLSYLNVTRGYGACNIFLREKFEGYLNETMEINNDDSPTDKQDKKEYPNYSYWSWAYIVWRGYGDTFFILNKMLYRNTGKLADGRNRGPTTALWTDEKLPNTGTKIGNGNLEDLIKEIFYKLHYVYFRQDNIPGLNTSDRISLEVYPYYPISYNDDYIAKLCTEITVPNITIGNDAFYYYLLNSDGDLVQTKSRFGDIGDSNFKPKTLINNTVKVHGNAEKLFGDTYKYNLDEDFLTFVPQNSNIKSNTKQFRFKIPKVKYVDTLGPNIEGLIRHKVEDDYRIYIRDVDGYSLSNAFYNVADGDIVDNDRTMDDEVYDFVNHFTVKNNEMVIRQSYAEANDSNKVYMGCASRSRRMILEIGGCQYIELPDWRTISSQKNYYTLFGNRTAYYGSGSGGGARTNPEIPWSGEGGKSAYGQIGGGGSRTGGRITWEQSVTDN